MTALCALSRILPFSRSIWDWDEALFCLGMREYDVTMHHPHPPGFPVFIGMAKVLRVFIGNDFRALQGVSLIASVFVFPAVFLLARELRMRFETSVIAGALFAFFPNVWFFGGTAFSDVPSIVLVTFAIVFLLRGTRSRNAYWFGTFLLALAIGIRPQNLLVGLFPGVVATLRRPWRDVLVALLIGVVIVGVAFGAAIHATGNYAAFMTTVRAHADYIARIDSYHSPERPALWRLFDRFFQKQYQSPPLSAVISIFVAISIVGAIRCRDRSMLWNFLTFAPFALTAWLMLDRYSISRFSIGYQPMFAVFAADGIARAARGRVRFEEAIGAVMVLAFILWTVPELGPVRNQLSPPVLAVDAVLSHLDPRRDQLFIGYSMTPFMEYLAPSFPITRVMDDRALPLTPPMRPWLLAEVSEKVPEVGVFLRERNRLWNIARHHYFEVVLQPLRNLPQFVSGWYPAERSGMDEFRWMQQQSVTMLPPASGDTVLRLLFNVPPDLVGATVTVSLNGNAIDRITVSGEEASRDLHVKPSPGPNRLDLSIDRRTSFEGRAVGLRMRFLSWGPG